MVFIPLADWKVRLLSMGMFEERSRQLLGSCWVVGGRSDWMTRLTRHRVLYQSKTSSIMTSWSGHHCAISHHHCTIQWWVMRSNCYWIGPSLTPGICQVSITLFSSCDPFSILLYHLLSHTMSYAPILTHLWTNFFPMMTLSLCPWWFICSHNPLHFLTILPIVLTLLLAFVSFVVLFMVWTFVEFCHGHSFST